MTFESNRNFHNNRLVFAHFEEVDVKNFVGYRVELDVLQNGLLGFAVYGEVDNEDFRSVDELTNIFLVDNYIGSDDGFLGVSRLVFGDFNHLLTFFECAFVRKGYYFAAINYGRDFAFGTQCLCSFLAKVSSWRSC